MDRRRRRFAGLRGLRLRALGRRMLRGGRISAIGGRATEHAELGLRRPLPTAVLAAHTESPRPVASSPELPASGPVNVLQSRYVPSIGLSIPDTAKAVTGLDVFTLVAIMAPLGIGFAFSWSRLGRVCGQFDLADIGL